ncbi:AlpA family phage regulatory protein [Sinirhodobacter huangdaonensis]|uniref:AlpA family phage regulatory protein n=2 Tax=Paenirhodobacter huangdaonensis TaxID=2501515 RepID=A0A3S3PH93_9RHOB|nr:AlpA family phage regulatory protein [Sinirhodobacter huangdaonensis]
MQPPTGAHMQILMKTPDVCAATGMKRPTLYEHMAKGLFPRPIKLAPKLATWPKDEVAKINAARIAGADDEAIKALVIELTEARKSAV